MQYITEVWDVVHSCAGNRSRGRNQIWSKNNLISYGTTDTVAATYTEITYNSHVFTFFLFNLGFRWISSIQQMLHR